MSLGFCCFVSMSFNVEHIHNVFRKRQAERGLSDSLPKKKKTKKDKLMAPVLPLQSLIIGLKKLRVAKAPT